METRPARPEGAAPTPAAMRAAAAAFDAHYTLGQWPTIQRAIALAIDEASGLPELLAAANNALAGMDGGEDHSLCHTGICSRGECSQCQRVDGLRKAIAKAEGR